jgi:hypothetical protein
VTTVWVVERTRSRRFPVRVSIEQDGRLVVAVRAQAPWPGPGKRCEFLTVRKERRDGGGSHEQVFFRTESAIRAHRSRGRVELRATAAALAIVIDSAARYPWRFPGPT